MLRLRPVAFLATVVLVASACTGAGPSASAPAATAGGPTAAASQPAESQAAQPKTGGTLVVAIPGDLNRTDSALVDDANSTYVLQQIMETLVTLAPGTGDKIVGALAKTWDVSADGKTYTFHLNSGIKFHDGTDFNAAAVKFNFDRWINIPQAYSDLGYTYYIDSVLGRGDATIIASTAAPDDSTFVVTLKNPNSGFLIEMTLTPFAIASPKALQDGNASAADFKDNKYAQGGPPAAVGTGPFMFKDWVAGDHVDIVKNPNYWNTAAGGPYLDQVTFKPIADTTATLNALQSEGGVDIAQTIAPNDVATVKGDSTLQYFDRGGACNEGVLGMNQLQKPFDNLKIRQAVATAINKDALVKAFFGDTGVIPTSWAPPGTKFLKDEPIPTYDVNAAKQLVTDSGLTGDALKFDFWYPSNVSRPYMPDPKGEFEAITSDLEAIGLKPNPKTAPWRPDYLAAESSGKYPMWLIGWNCDWLGIDNFLVTAWFGYHNGKPNPEYAEKNDALNQAYLDALAASDEATQTADWAKAQDLILADMPSVPLVSAKTPSAGRTYVKGFIPSPTLLEMFQSVWLDK